MMGNEFVNQLGGQLGGEGKGSILSRSISFHDQPNMSIENLSFVSRSGDLEDTVDCSSSSRSEK